MMTAVYGLHLSLDKQISDSGPSADIALVISFRSATPIRSPLERVLAYQSQASKDNAGSPCNNAELSL